MHHSGIVADACVKKHNTGPHHPEQAARFTAVMNRLEWSGLSRDLTLLNARPADDDELALAHTRPYIALVGREVAERRDQLSTGDTAIMAQSEEAARLAAGSVICAVDAVFAHEVENAFAVVRPPGHHASADRGMGFCLFNNVAVAARYAQKKYGAERVLIADWDVHHGNGTQDIFYEDGSVLFFSTHQAPWYPGTGARDETGKGAGEGKTINCPLPAGSGRAEVVGAFRQQLLPAAEQFQPDLVLLSAGFDSRMNDPLGHFRLSDADFSELTEIMLDIAAKYCDGRLVSVLEGGYNLEGLAMASEAHVRALCGAIGDAV
jgi:acetoin utilization deacetylase AcuC-like enzyme